MHYDYDDMRLAALGKKRPRYSSHEVEITCVTKAEGTNPEQAITSAGGVRKDGKPWKLTVEEIIQSIEHNVEFYIVLNKKKLRIIVARHNNRKYIKTGLDRDIPHTLLQLPDCPA